MTMLKHVFLLITIGLSGLAKGQQVPDIKSGTGSFTIPGGAGHEQLSIVVHYFKPENFEPDSPILLVIPGGGRNGNDYRDSWIEAAKKYNLLILSPSYAREHYPNMGDYNMGRTAKVKYGLISEKIKPVKDPTEWIFQDFDRIFDLAVQATGSNQSQYDLFGHSAGAQIIHRMALFYPDGKVKRAVAANSGWYTLPSDDEKFPYGLKGFSYADLNLKKSFDFPLIIHLGEKDDENETRGDLRKTAEAMRQGSGRYGRGNYFYAAAKKQADLLNLPLVWQKVVTENVGHSYKEMGMAAAKLLYEP